MEFLQHQSNNAVLGAPAGVPIEEFTHPPLSLGVEGDGELPL